MSIIFSPFPMYLFFKGNKIPVYSLVMVLFHVSHRILQGDYTYYDDAPEDILLRPPPPSTSFLYKKDEIYLSIKDLFIVWVFY